MMWNFCNVEQHIIVHVDRILSYFIHYYTQPYRSPKVRVSFWCFVYADFLINNKEDINGIGWSTIDIGSVIQYNVFHLTFLFVKYTR